MENAPNAVNDLEKQVKQIKDEVDSLQISVMGQKVPWYKNIPTIISVTALLFSFGTTYVSNKRIQAQDVQNTKSELRGMLQRLSSLPKESIELTKKYENDPMAIALFSGCLNQENVLLAQQAAELVRKLPKDRVYATEYYAVALALQNAYDIEKAMEFMQDAIKASTDLINEEAALRAYAALLFISGKPEAGREAYQKTLDVFSRYKSYDSSTQITYHIMAEINWALSEANIGFMDLANQHIERAEEYVSDLGPGPNAERMRKQVDQTKLMLRSYTQIQY